MAFMLTVAPQNLGECLTHSLKCRIGDCYNFRWSKKNLLNSAVGCLFARGEQT